MNLEDQRRHARELRALGLEWAMVGASLGVNARRAQRLAARTGPEGKPGRPPSWDWLQTVPVGASFGLPRRRFPSYHRHPENVRAIGRQWGARLSIRAIAPGLIVTRVA